MRKRKMYLSVEDIAELFGLSVSFAYRVVERMNADLASKNYYVILGRVPTRYVEDKGEAKEWERDFLQQQSQGVDIEFGNFLEIYYKDMDVRLRENTMYTKRYIIDLKIKPYFEKKILSEITVADVRAWQNELLTYKDIFPVWKAA